MQEHVLVGVELIVALPGRLFPRRGSDIRILLDLDNEDYQTVNVIHHQLLLPPNP